MNFIKHDYYIVTKDGIQLCAGYLYTDRGILFGIDKRNNEWIITDIKTGLKVTQVALRKYCRYAVSKREIEFIKNLHKEKYIKYGKKFFISGNEELLDKFLEV